MNTSLRDVHSVRPVFADVVAVLVLLAIPSAPSVAQSAPVHQYTVTDLGSSVWPNGINNHGQVVGNNAAGHAFLYDAHATPAMRDIHPEISLGGVSSEAFDINAVGQIVGYADTGQQDSNGNTLYHSLRYNLITGILDDIGTLGGAMSQARTINNLGQVAGVSQIPPPATCDDAYFWSGIPGDAMLDIQCNPPSAGGISWAASINDNGQIVGTMDFYSYSAFIWNIGDTALTPLSAGTSATGITDNGNIVGMGLTNPFLIQNGQVTYFGATGSEAYGLNNLAQVVGNSGGGASVSHATIYQNGVVTDLNDCFPTNSGWTLVTAYKINDSGQIIGWGNYNNEPHGFLLTVAPDVRVKRTLKGQEERLVCTYNGRNYWGHISTFIGTIEYLYQGQQVTHNCWEAQDIVQEGTYSGIDGIMSTGNPGVNLLNTGIPSPTVSSIWIHYGTGFDSSTGPWTTGCIVFSDGDGTIDDLVSTPLPNPVPQPTVEVDNSFPQLGPDDYSVSGTVCLEGGKLRLQGATITLSQNGQQIAQTHTDSSGHYWLYGFMPGTYVISASLPGYTFKLNPYSSPLPWLSVTATSDVQVTMGWPPDCYGVDLIALRPITHLIWQNQTTGDVTSWVMNGTQYTGSWGFIGHNVPSDWKIRSAY